jgi:DNA-binding NtrC family response regulator
MGELLEMASKIAPTEVSALIQGESGTGKELVARHIHDHSKRARSKMVSVNCGAIQETLLLSELFGHERGAFTGATAQKQGLVELANGGTLFLDEIGEMGLDAQAKLLRFLQEGEFRRVGGQEPIHVDVRVISATNKDLESQVKLGRFREDLFYRINTVTLRMLPLRKRKDDVPLLVNHFLKNGCDSAKGVSEAAMARLCAYPWPGNVRELQNLVERFKVLVDGPTVELDDLPAPLNREAEETTEHEPLTTFLLDQIEKKHILRVLNHFRGNKTKAAQAMGITVKTLYNKLAVYEKEREEVSHREAAVMH